MFNKNEGFMLLIGGIVVGFATGYTIARAKFIEVISKAALENAVEKKEDQEEEA